MEKKIFDLQQEIKIKTISLEQDEEDCLEDHIFTTDVHENNMNPNN